METGTLHNNNNDNNNILLYHAACGCIISINDIASWPNERGNYSHGKLAEREHNIFETRRLRLLYVSYRPCVWTCRKLQLRCDQTLSDRCD